MNTSAIIIIIAILVPYLILSIVSIIKSEKQQSFKAVSIITLLLLMTLLTTSLYTIHLQSNIKSEFGYNEHDYIVNENGIIEHSDNCHCFNDTITR